MTMSIPLGESPTSLTGATPSPTPSAPPLDPNQATASQIIQQQLSQWGLSTLAPLVNNLIRQGYGQDAILLQLEQSPEFKARFSGNDARGKAGLPVLSPAEYIATERSYAQVLQQYGIPSGFWDSQADFAKLIGNDMSASELQARAQDAQAVWLSKDTSTRQAWTQMYGLSDGAAIASILDPQTALPIVQRMTAASQIGGAALQNGLGIDQSRMEQYADLGVSQSQAQKGFGQIAEQLGTDQQIAARFGTSWTQAQAEQATLLGNGQAQKQQNDLENAEKQLFSARASADQNTTATRSTGSY